MVSPSTINHGAIHIKKHHDLGRPAPIVASFGHSPLIYLSSAMPMPYGMSELAYAGAIAQRPIEVRLGELTGLPIPAHGEQQSLELTLPPLATIMLRAEHR